MIELLLLSLLAQDEHKLAWKPVEGQKAFVTWKFRNRVRVVAEKMPPYIYELGGELSGRISVVSIGRDGLAECLISIRKHEIKGHMRQLPVHLLLEDGEMLKSTGFDKDDKDMPKIVNKPIWIKLASGGSFTTEASEEVTKYFSGHDSALGPVLPDGAVKAGATWKAALVFAPENPELGIKALEGSWKLASVEKGLAKITMDETLESTLKGVKVKNVIKREATFDVGAGRVVKQTKSWRVTGSGEIKGEKGSIDMEMMDGFTLEPIEK